MRTVRYALLLVLMTLVRIEAESTPEMKELEAAQERLKHVGDHVDRNGNRIDREKDPRVLAGHRRTQFPLIQRLSWSPLLRNPLRSQGPYQSKLRRHLTR